MAGYNFGQGSGGQLATIEMQAGKQEMAAIADDENAMISDYFMDNAMMKNKAAVIEKYRIAGEEREDVRQLSQEERKDTRQIAGEERADTRQIAKEERGVLANVGKDKAAIQNKQADTGLKNAQAEYYRSGKESGKSGSKPSGYTLDGKELTLDQAKLRYKEFKDQDPEAMERYKESQMVKVNKQLEKSGLDSTNFFTTYGDIDSFIELYDLDPEAAKAEDLKAYNVIHKALKGTTVFKDYQKFLDSKSTGSSKPMMTKAQKEKKLQELKAQKAAQGK